MLEPNATGPSNSIARQILPPAVVAASLFPAAIFGFFYAWSCSVMWGLDTVDPRAAIEAMQGVNREIRNAAFAPAFFGTPMALAATAALAAMARQRPAAVLLGLAAIVYLLGAMLLTIMINVPMNEALGTIAIPADVDAARELWRRYSSEWTFWNHVRTGFSALAVLLTSAALLAIGRGSSH